MYVNPLSVKRVAYIVSQYVFILKIVQFQVVKFISTLLCCIWILRHCQKAFSYTLVIYNLCYLLLLVQVCFCFCFFYIWISDPFGVYFVYYKRNESNFIISKKIIPLSQHYLLRRKKIIFISIFCDTTFIICYVSLYNLVYLTIRLLTAMYGLIYRIIIQRSLSHRISRH